MRSAFCFLLVTKITKNAPPLWQTCGYPKSNAWIFTAEVLLVFLLSFAHYSVTYMQTLLVNCCSRILVIRKYEHVLWEHASATTPGLGTEQVRRVCVALTLTFCIRGQHACSVAFHQYMLITVNLKSYPWREIVNLNRRDNIQWNSMRNIVLLSDISMSQYSPNIKKYPMYVSNSLEMVLSFIHTEISRSHCTIMRNIRKNVIVPVGFDNSSSNDFKILLLMMAHVQSCQTMRTHQSQIGWEK